MDATGGGNSSSSIAEFYGAFAGTSVRASHLASFEMPNVDDVAAHYSHWVHTYDVEAILAEMYETNRATWVSR